MLRLALKGLQRIDQLGFVVEDLERAATVWAGNSGVGPFFFWDRIEYPIFEFEGVPCQPEMSLAFAYAGDVQIELIVQHNDAPTAYSKLRGLAGSGLVHVAQYVDDTGAASRAMRDNGARLVQYGRDSEGLEIMYFEGGPHLGGYVEFIGTNAARSARRERMKQVAATWDGSRPFRPIEEIS